MTREGSGEGYVEAGSVVRQDVGRKHWPLAASRSRWRWTGTRETWSVFFVKYDGAPRSHPSHASGLRYSERRALAEKQVVLTGSIDGERWSLDHSYKVVERARRLPPSSSSAAGFQMEANSESDVTTKKPPTQLSNSNLRESPSTAPPEPEARLRRRYLLVLQIRRATPHHRSTRSVDLASSSTGGDSPEESTPRRSKSCADPDDQRLLFSKNAVVVEVNYPDITGISFSPPLGMFPTRSFMWISPLLTSQRTFRFNEQLFLLVQRSAAILTKVDTMLTASMLGLETGKDVLEGHAERLTHGHYCVHLPA
ncbi:hypothetical protein C8F01DRAFT_1225164 [Mycena amicta]|nr:hypothetical protein C8F01DRAFT_1225164 [Mycena amicta]